MTMFNVIQERDRAGGGVLPLVGGHAPVKRPPFLH